MSRAGTVRVKRCGDGLHWVVEIVSAAGYVLAETVPVDRKDHADRLRAEICRAMVNPSFKTDP